MPSPSGPYTDSQVFISNYSHKYQRNFCNTNGCSSPYQCPHILLLSINSISDSRRTKKQHTVNPPYHVLSTKPHITKVTLCKINPDKTFYMPSNYTFRHFCRNLCLPLPLRARFYIPKIFLYNNICSAINRSELKNFTILSLPC